MTNIKKRRKSVIIQNIQVIQEKVVNFDLKYSILMSESLKNQLMSGVDLFLEVFV